MLQKLEGHFLQWQDSPVGKAESILIQTSTIVQSVYLGKNLRHLLMEFLQPGMSLSLQAKVKKHYLQAKFIVLLPSGAVDVSRSSVRRISGGKPATVQVCTSKHCCRNGSEEICSALENIAHDANIKVREVGCLGHCRNAPVVKIGDRKYQNLSPKKVVSLALESTNSKQSNSSSKL
jgi:hypothetical protein